MNLNCAIVQNIHSNKRKVNGRNWVKQLDKDHTFLNLSLLEINNINLLIESNFLLIKKKKQQWLIKEGKRKKNKSPNGNKNYRAGIKGVC